ncbi:hypothetical protein QBC40DRAFT_271634 [Triangularia verruculosa]|uniref:Secreted protein n=1 Tax=Triangularia verruculosa TaxID=2587418 RepID=A0AAN7AZT2_9PEZI|nr:hypothetical protein QBC40DRAFT_271634 [Triangularia verruculosa]
MFRLVNIAFAISEVVIAQTHRTPSGRCSKTAAYGSIGPGLVRFGPLLPVLSVSWHSDGIVYTGWRDRMKLCKGLETDGLGG